VKNNFLESQGIKINGTADCDLDETEKLSKIEIRNYHNKSKYVVIYACIILPLFIVFYIQNERIKRFNEWEPIGNYSSFIKSSKGAKSSKKGNRARKYSNNKESFGNIMIQKLLSVSNKSSFLSTIGELFGSYNDKLQDQDISDITSDPAFLYHFNLDQKTVAKCNPSPCKLCDEFGDSSCPNHEHLYSTDEASSSEIDFAGPSANRAGKGKAKKNKKKVKRFRYAN